MCRAHQVVLVPESQETMAVAASSLEALIDEAIPASIHALVAARMDRLPAMVNDPAFVDGLQSLRPRYPGVNFLTVVSGAGEDRVKSLVADHHWTFPVAIDRNLAVFNTYRVSLCATTVFAYRGGIVRATKVEAQRYTDAQLNAAIRATQAR